MPALPRTRHRIAADRVRIHVVADHAHGFGRLRRQVDDGAVFRADAPRFDAEQPAGLRFHLQLHVGQFGGFDVARVTEADDRGKSVRKIQAVDVVVPFLAGGHRGAGRERSAAGGHQFERLQALLQQRDDQRGLGLQFGHGVALGAPLRLAPHVAHHQAGQQPCQRADRDRHEGRETAGRWQRDRHPGTSCLRPMLPRPSLNAQAAAAAPRRSLAYTAGVVRRHASRGCTGFDGGREIAWRMPRG